MASTPHRVLIVEDDDSIATNLFTYFERQGFSVEVVYSGQAALHRCSVDRFDVILLDIGLPSIGGLTVLQRLRSELRLATPVLVISARSDLSDKLAGFERGADDYLTKPFALAEAHARVRALLNRAGGYRVDTVIRWGGLEFDPSQGEARVNGRAVRLTPKASQLLALLLREPGRLVRRDEVEHALWPAAPPLGEAVRSQVHGLRKALADAGFDGLETVHGVGYRLIAVPSSPEA